MTTDKTHTPPCGWELFAPELTLGEARARLFALGAWPKTAATATPG